MLTGFEDFASLGAGDAQVLNVAFDPVTAGLFEQVVGISLYGTTRHNQTDEDAIDAPPASAHPIKRPGPHRNRSRNLRLFLSSAFMSRMR